MPENLLQPGWSRLDTYELRLLLDEYIGGPGQFDDRAKNPNKFFLPSADPPAQVVLTFRGDEITAIEQGPAFDATNWAALSDAVVKAFNGPVRVGRDYSFCGLRVTGFWRGAAPRARHWKRKSTPSCWSSRSRKATTGL